MTRLGDVCEKIGSGATPRGGKEAYKDAGIPIIRSQNIHDWVFQPDGLAFLDDEQAESLSNVEVRSNDVLLNITGDSVARACIVPSERIPARVNQHVAIVRAGKEINPTYLLAFLQSKKTTLLSLASSGATRNALTKRMIENLDIDLPSREIQDSIAQVLDSIQHKITLNNRLNDYLEQLCQSLFDRFDNDENNLFVKVSDIADVNPRRTLKKGEEALCVEMADLSTTGAFPTDWRTKAYNGGVKFVNGDTILARITPCLENGKAGYINFLEQDEVAFGSTEYIVLTSKGELPSEFFYFLARNEDFISYATAHMNGSSGRQRVSGADVGNYEVRMPSEKQVSEFKEIAGKAMRVISASSIESRKLAQSRDALLPKLMSGEIDVSEVDLTQPTNNHLSGCGSFCSVCCPSGLASEFHE